MMTHNELCLLTSYCSCSCVKASPPWLNIFGKTSGTKACQFKWNLFIFIPLFLCLPLPTSTYAAEKDTEQWLPFSWDKLPTNITHRLRGKFLPPTLLNLNIAWTSFPSCCLCFTLCSDFHHLHVELKYTMWCVGHYSMCVFLRIPRVGVLRVATGKLKADRPEV